jgi:hypothetical protein
MNFKIGFIGMLILFAILESTTASALPAFARKNNLQCSACHTAFPALTAMGREFMEAGYRFPGSAVGDLKVTDKLQFDKNFPMSLALIARPYTDSKEGETEIRAIHEGEIYAAGEIFNNISGMMEVESEGEDGFGLVLSMAHITYNQSQALNVQTGYGPTMMADPYDTYSDIRRLTATHYALLNQTFGNTDNGDKLRHARQQFSVFGRPTKQLFYYAGVGGLTGDLVGSDSSVLFGRIAFDIAPGMMLGALILDGDCEISDCPAASKARNFTRSAIDGQFDIGELRLTGVYMQAKDDTDAGGDVSNNSYYLQGYYRVMKNGRPTLVPLLRLGSYEANDGNDTYSLATANLSYYLDENVKGFIEYQDIYDTPTGVPKDNVTTVQVEIVF